jgi:hypothetical protein
MASRLIPSLTSISLLLSLSGCQTFGGQPARPFDTQQRVAKLETYFDPARTAECAKAKDKICRDEIITGQLQALDLLFADFEKEILETSERLNVVGDSLVSVLGAAGTVVTGTQTKSILAALSSSVTGVKGTFDKNLYFQKSAHVLIGRMRALRKEALVTIREGLLQAVDRYPLSQAALDIENYFIAGTISSAVIDIDQASDQQSEAADNEIKQMLRLSYGTDDNSALLRAFWRPNGIVDPTRDRQLRDWINSNGLQGLDPASFINAKEYAEARKKAATELVSPGNPNN